MGKRAESQRLPTAENPPKQDRFAHLPGWLPPQKARSPGRTVGMENDCHRRAGGRKLELQRPKIGLVSKNTA